MQNLSLRKFFYRYISGKFHYITLEEDLAVRNVALFDQIKIMKRNRDSRLFFKLNLRCFFNGASRLHVSTKVCLPFTRMSRQRLTALRAKDLSLVIYKPNACYGIAKSVWLLTYLFPRMYRLRKSMFIKALEELRLYLLVHTA